MVRCHQACHRRHHHHHHHHHHHDGRALVPKDPSQQHLAIQVSMAAMVLASLQIFRSDDDDDDDDDAKLVL
jgi:hypothetical protein